MNLLGFIIATIIGIAIAIVIDGGDIIIRGTKKYNKFDKETDDKIKRILKNGSGSSKEELQEWWNTYHKK